MRRHIALPPSSDWPDGMYVDENGAALTAFFQAVISVALLAFATGWAQVLGAVALLLSTVLLVSSDPVRAFLVRRYTDHG